MPYRQSEKVVTAEPESGKLVLLSLESGEYHSLNEAGVLLWQRLAGTADTGALAELLRVKFGLDAESAARDADAFIESLRTRGLVEVE